jgi:hypothetical protein
MRPRVRRCCGDNGTSPPLARRHRRSMTPRSIFESPHEALRRRRCRSLTSPKYQDAVLENVRALITEAELLCVHSHFARSFFLSIIAVEETSKILMLIECAKKINAGENQDWPNVHEMLNNHPAKLKANLMLYRSRRLGGMPPVGGGDTNHTDQPTLQRDPVD